MNLHNRIAELVSLLLGILVLRKFLSKFFLSLAVSPATHKVFLPVKLHEAPLTVGSLGTNASHKATMTIMTAMPAKTKTAILHCALRNSCILLQQQGSFRSILSLWHGCLPGLRWSLELSWALSALLHQVKPHDEGVQMQKVGISNALCYY